MSYENLKKELTTAVTEHYQSGTPINDIRAALHAADLMAEQYGAIELLEIAKSMANKPDDVMSVDQHGYISETVAEEIRSLK